ncbi:MAG: DUF285 domain-containing protein [Pseudobacteriovorax sp.]|nr:DUF285 domain-containing protein [Pseudobacteriovorax sp.]
MSKIFFYLVAGLYVLSASCQDSSSSSAALIGVEESAAADGSEQIAITGDIALSVNSIPEFTIGSGQSPSGALEFTVVNNGDDLPIPVDAILIEGVNAENFEIIVNGCQEAPLKTRETCKFQIRGLASYNGQFSGAVTARVGVSRSNTIALSLEAKGFVTELAMQPTVLPDIIYDHDNPEASQVTFTLSNRGEGASGTINAPKISGDQAAIYKLVSDECSGQILDAKASCDFVVTFEPGDDIGFTGTMEIGDGLTQTVPVTLAGRAFGYHKFISRWDTTASGISGNNQINLPLDKVGTYNFMVDWGDGNRDIITAWDAPETTHSYAAPGEYIVTISGVLNGWSFNDNKDERKIREIMNWGGRIELGNSGSNFEGAQFLVSSATDAPNLTNTTNYQAMFANARLFNQDISNWDVSAGTRFDFMFRNAEVFNQDIGDWNVSQSISFERMFDSADDFNQDLGSWDVSQSLNFDNMLRGSDLNTENYNAILIGWSNLQLMPDMSINFGSVRYSGADAINARQSIVANFRWNIIDNGVQP